MILYVGVSNGVACRVCRWIFTTLSNFSDANLPHDDNSLTKVNAQHVVRRLKIDDPLLSAIFFDYCFNLTEKLSPPILRYAEQPSRPAKELVWTSFHSLCSTGVLKRDWVVFCRSIDLQEDIYTHGLLGTYIGHQVLIKMTQMFGFSDAGPQSMSVTNLTNDELAALHYVAGYVVRTIRKRTKGMGEEAEQHRHALDSMCSFSDDDETEENCETFVKRWLSLTNRGGLVLVSDCVFQFFVMVERKCRSYLNVSRIAVEKRIDIKKTAEDIMAMDEIILAWSEMMWELVSDEFSTSLLLKILTLYLTVRGFSFVRGWIEQLKKDCQKSHLPPSKSLRTGLKSKHKK